jgi:large conductance mechanosensitive channel
MATLRGFKNFLMQGDLIVVAVGLVIALAFSTLIKAFTDNVITPLVNAAGGGGSTGLGFHVKGQLVNLGAKRRGVTVFGEPAPTKSCPECLSGGLPLAAARCKFCGAAIGADAAA